MHAIGRRRTSPTPATNNHDESVILDCGSEGTKLFQHRGVLAPFSDEFLFDTQMKEHSEEDQASHGSRKQAGIVSDHSCPSVGSWAPRTSLLVAGQRTDGYDRHNYYTKHTGHA